MSGYKDDIISILKHNSMYHREATGLILGQSGGRELLEHLESKMFPVIGKYEKSIILFDYIVLNRYQVDVPSLIKAFSSVSVGGIIVLELDGETDYGKNYYSQFGGFSANKIKYDDRYYMVIHSGVDYGD